MYHFTTNVMAAKITSRSFLIVALTNIPLQLFTYFVRLRNLRLTYWKLLRADVKATAHRMLCRIACASLYGAYEVNTIFIPSLTHARSTLHSAVAYKHYSMRSISDGFLGRVMDYRRPS